MIKLKTLTLYLLASLSIVSAQEPSSVAQNPSRFAQKPALIKQGYKNAFSIEPLYLFNNGLRLNYERQLVTPKHWLEGSLIGYVVDYRNTDRDMYLSNGSYNTWFLNSRDISNAWSLGTEINYKYYLRPFLYLSAGGAYSHTAVTDETATFRKFKEDDLTFYEHVWGKQTQRFDRVACNLRLGFQSKYYRRVVVGGYIGFTFTHSFFNPRNDDDYASEDDITDLRYSGMLPHIGFRLGFRL